MSENYDKLLQYALRLISNRRYTENEMKQKLQHKNFSNEADIKKVMARVKDLNYINDCEYAKDYISNRLIQNPKGKHLLKIELALKGIRQETIDCEIEKADIDEVKIAEDILKRKKQRFDKYSDQKRKEKIMRYLASRGFEFDTIYKILGMW